MNRHFVALILPLVLHLFLAAQQAPTVEKAAAHAPATLPDPTSTTAYDPYFSEGRGYWERNHLIYVDPLVPRVDIYDKDKFRSSVKVLIPDSKDTRVTDATATEDRRIIVSGCYLPWKDHIRCFIGVAHPDGHVSPMVDTGKFSPKQISSCDGATVWAIGWLRTGPDLDRDSPTDPYHILREYRLSDGKMVNSTLERATFALAPGPAVPSGHNYPDLTLRCAGKLLGVYEGESDEWIEYDLSSNRLNRWKLPTHDHLFGEYDSNGKMLLRSLPPLTRITGVAMLDSGEVYASFNRLVKDGTPKEIQVGLYRLQKAGDRGDWIAVPGTIGPEDQPGAFEKLNGTDGVNLVYSRFGEHFWSFSPAPH